jgi:hypothetical protein
MFVGQLIHIFGDLINICGKTQRQLYILPNTDGMSQSQWAQVTGV